MKRRWLGFFILFIGFPFYGVAQAVGGNTVYNFLSLPATAKATGLGGMNISRIGNDLGLAFNNPSLLNDQMNEQIQLSVKPYFADIQQYNFSGINYLGTKKIILGWGLQYMDYGTIPMTDNIGNGLGQLHPNEYAIQLASSWQYQSNFHVGATIKFIQSTFGMYKSNGLAMDLGIHYVSNNELSSASILVSNFGKQLTTYQLAENLPYNIIVGWSKKLAAAPFQFSVTAQRLSSWNTSFNDVGFNTLESLESPTALQNVFNHLILSTEVNLGKQFNMDLGYNFLRRNELNIQNQQNFMNGVSVGLGWQLNRMQLQYSNAFFQRNLYHHFTIAYQLRK